ncbi:hypothetical protein IFVP182_C2220011 [Vibrio parahaemolyticus]
MHHKKPIKYQQIRIINYKITLLSIMLVFQGNFVLVFHFMLIIYILLAC